jgi:hypothetical protein
MILGLEEVEKDWWSEGEEGVRDREGGREKPCQNLERKRIRKVKIFWAINQINILSLAITKLPLVLSVLNMKLILNSCPSNIP